MSENKKKQNRKVTKAGFCGQCGTEVPADRRYLIHLYERGNKEMGFVFHIAFACPNCGAETYLNWSAKESALEYIKAVGLYGKDSGTEKMHWKASEEKKKISKKNEVEKAGK